MAKYILSRNKSYQYRYYVNNSTHTSTKQKATVFPNKYQATMKCKELEDGHIPVRLNEPEEFYGLDRSKAGRYIIKEQDVNIFFKSLVIDNLYGTACQYSYYKEDALRFCFKDTAEKVCKFLNSMKTDIDEHGKKAKFVVKS